MKRLYMGSCYTYYWLDIMGKRVLNDYNPDVMFHYGDFPYTEHNLTRWGVTSVDITTSLAINTDPDTYRNHHTQQRAMPYTKDIIANAKQFWYMWDDHETCCEDGARNLTWYQGEADGNGGLTWSGSATQQNMEDAWDASRLAAVENMTTNPANTDAGIDADAEYFSYILGSVTYIVTDCMQYRSPRDATDDASKFMLGTTQKDWVIDKVNNALTPFVCIFTKPVHRTGGNLDTYYYYQTELQSMIGDFAREGVCFLSGDQHWPAVAYEAINSVNILNVVGCPTAQTMNTQSGPIDTANVWKWGGVHQNAAQLDTQAALLVEDPENDEWIKIRILSPNKEVDHWFGYLQAGSNSVVYSI